MKKPRYRGLILRLSIQNLFEIGGSPFYPLTLLAFGNVFNFAIFEKGLHLYLTTAGAEKLLSSTGCTSILTGLSHGSFSLPEKTGC